MQAEATSSQGVGEVLRRPRAARLRLVERGTPAPTLAPAPEALDAESSEWLRSLRAGDATTRDEATVRLHALLMRAARFEVARRRPTLPHLRGDELEDIATEAADDALMSVLRRLPDFRGASRFTTWAYKFALLEAAVKLRKRSWQGREVPLEPEGWGLFSSRAERAPADAAEGDR
jgi:RNA polymerase sigma-70 factor, ECF subfamily